MRKKGGNNMKAGVFYGKESLIIEDLKMPQPNDDEIVIKVMACGICGTDIHIFDGDEGAASTPKGTVLGHELSGIVTEIGKNVKNVNVGDRVCVDPNKLCGSCYWCRNAIGHFCENMVGIGTTVNGGFAQYCKIPKSQAYKFSDSLSFSEAAMTEPVACCLHGIDLCDIKTDDTVLIIGGGMIGMIMIQLARVSGAAKIIVIETQEDKRSILTRLGADLVINPINEDVSKLLSENDIERVSKVIECVGKTATMEQAIKLAGKKATVMLFGLTAPNDEIRIKPFEVFKKELTIKASYINPYTQKRALEMIESGRIDVSSMIYEKIPLEKLPVVLADKELRRKGKFIVTLEKEI